jgi:hypothetical protein
MLLIPPLSLIMKALRHKPETMYGQRKINPQIQKARAEQSEILFTKEEIQRRLVKVKSTLEQLDEYQGQSGRTKKTDEACHGTQSIHQIDCARCKKRNL